ncbi:RNA-binding protein [Candidatus Poribacteria bacterium]|nr:RNA-binding protein [Candidatus Poribacteria bacterium]
MANKALFSSATYHADAATTVNAAGGKAYELEAKEALAKFAVTNTFGGTFYASGHDQLTALKALVDTVSDNAFIAKLAVYSRRKGHMKDMPAYLLAVLATRDLDLFKQVFWHVADNAKMVKNFVQIVRSGVTGRRSLGTVPKKLVRAWLRNRNGNQLVNDNVGGEPSLRDILRMVHVRPVDDAQSAMFGYILGKDVDMALLPASLQHLKAFHAGETEEMPNVAFQLLTGRELSSAQWTQIARQAPWQMTRMNLNTFLRHGVFDSRDMVDLVAARLRDAAAIRKSRVMPYQLLAAYKNVDMAMPDAIIDALHDAMEIACEQVPAYEGKKLVIAVDVSGSMDNPVTGHRGTATSKVTCVDVAGLMASALLRKNPDAVVVPFENKIVKLRLDHRDTVMTNSQRLSDARGGGTNCGMAMEHIAAHHGDADVVIFISDNESWMDYAGKSRGWYRPQQSATLMADTWKAMRRKNRKAKLVLIDVTPTTDSQNYTQDNVLNVGGFSDAVFGAVDGFISNDVSGVGYWESVITAEI